MVAEKEGQKSQGKDSRQSLEINNDFDTKAKERQVSGQIEAAKVRVASFIRFAEADMRLGVDLVPEIQEMRELQKSLDQLQKSFLERLWVIVRHPRKTYSERKKNKEAKKMQDEEVLRVAKYAEKISDKIEKIRGEIVSRGWEFSGGKEVMQGDLEELLKMLNTDDAKKSEMWAKSNEEFKRLFSVVVGKLLEQKKESKALQLYKLFNAGFSESQEVELVDLIVAKHKNYYPVPYSLSLEKVSSYSYQINLENFRRSALAVENELKGSERLLVLYNPRKPDIQKEYLGPVGLLLLEHPRSTELLLGLYDFPQLSISSADDVTVLETIVSRFDGNKRKNLAEKILPFLHNINQADISCEAVYTALIIADFPEATSDHLQKLSIGKIKALSAVMIVSGEEEVKKLWNEESVYVFGRLYYRDDNVDYNSLLSFAKELSPDLKKHLPTEFSSSSGQTDEKLGRTIWYNEGLHGKVLHLRELQSMVLSVPSDLRESFFVALEPVKRVFWSEGKFIRESVSNYIDYSERCTGSTGITYGDFINNLDFFSSERYPAVKKGFEVYKEAGLEAKVKNYFSLFELAGGLEGEAGNALALKFISQSDSCVKKRVNYGNISFIVEKRNASDTECLYKFSAFCQRAFVKDTDLLLQFLNFDEADVQIITSFLNNSLVANNEQLADIQVVEGEIIKLVREYKQLEEGADNPRAREYHRFTKLSREQKLDYTALSKKVKNASYQEVCRALFVAVESGSAKKILDFVALQNPNWLVDLEMTAKMAERPDCLGLFHYLGNRSGQDSLAAIDKLIALHDAGITDSITLSELINEKGDTEGQFIEEILKWDVAKLVKVTNEIEVLFPDLYRGRFSFFWFVCRENSTKDVEQIIRDVRHCVAYGQYYSFHHEVSEEEIGLEELRLQEAERVLGGEVENSKRHNLQWCSKDVWERLRTNRDWLVKCLEKNSFPYVIATVSDDMLNNKLFWGIELPDHKYPNELLITEEVIRKLFAVIEHLHSAGMEISQFQGHYGRQYWVAVVDAFEISPWLFSIDNLNFLKTTIPLHEVINIKDITPLEFVLLKQHSEFITFGHHNFLWWLRGLRAGKLLSLDELRTLNRSFSVKIPFEVFQMTEGRTGPNETVMDAILRLGREADGRIMAEIEGQHKKDILTLIGNIAPKLAGWLDSSYYSASFLQKISEIPPAYLTNLEIIFSGDNFSYFRSDESFFDTFVLIASHPGMGNVKRLMDLKLLGVYNLENVAPSKLATFLDRLTSQLIDDYQNICSYIDMSPLDTTDFFENQKLADLVIMFADQLQAIFDEGSISKKLSVYDLLVMDFESDLRNLKILQTNCFGKLSADTLQALSLVVEGEMLVTVQKVLAFFNGRQKIEYNSVKAQLDKMPPTLRVDVILNKGARNFGWEVLKYQE